MTKKEMKKLKRIKFKRKMKNRIPEKINAFHEEQIHNVSKALAKGNFLKTKNIELTEFSLLSVDENDKEFKKIFRDIKKRIVVANTPMQTISVDEYLKMPRI